MSVIKNTVKAVIFDMDGTVVDTERLGRIVTYEVLKTYGFNQLSQEQDQFLDSLIGMNFTSILNNVRRYFSIQDSLEKLSLEVHRQEELHKLNNITFIEGFETFHRTLQSHTIPNCIATNSEPRSLKTIAQAVGLTNFFGNNLYCIADVEYKPKPDPALFLYAANKLNAQPSECIVFEDSLYGFQAAQAAGMKCIAIKNKSNAHLLDSVHGAIDSYHDAIKIMEQIQP